MLRMPSMSFNPWHMLSSSGSKRSSAMGGARAGRGVGASLWGGARGDLLRDGGGSSQCERNGAGVLLIVFHVDPVRGRSRTRRMY